MSGSVIETTALARARLTRELTLTIGWKLALVGVADFLFLRIWGPDLINLHQDLALLGAILCLVLAGAATLWLLFQLWFDVRRFASARRDIARSNRLKAD
jgi:hypothetical protein